MLKERTTKTRVLSSVLSVPGPTSNASASPLRLIPCGKIKNFHHRLPCSQIYCHLFFQLFLD